MSEEKIVILYVDDEENNLVSFKANFRLKYQIHIALSGDEALKILAKKNIDIVITDQRMPNMTGVEFLEIVIDKFPEPMRLLLTGYTDMTAVIDAVNKGKFFHYLTKPWNEAEMDKTIANAYAVLKERRDRIKMNEKLELANDQLEFMLRQKLLS